LEVRLVQLMASFISVCSDYALARLEFSLHFPGMRSPPVISRFPDASEETLRDQWERVESQLDAARAYVAQIDARVGFCLVAA